MVRSKQRTKRRRFHGNRFTDNTKQNVTVKQSSYSTNCMYKYQKTKRK